MKRVVITGLGTVNPLGSTVEKFWENVKKGTLGVSKIDSFDTTELGVSVAGIIRDFDPAEYFDRKDVRHMERFTQIAVASAIQALQDAGTDFKDMDPYRVGTIIGCGIGARLTGFKTYDSVSIGLGMVSRGEVALIVAQKGSMAGLISGTMFPAVVLMVIVTTLVTPLLLKVGMKRPTPDNTEPAIPATA